MPPSFNQLMAFLKNMPKVYDEKMRTFVASPEFKGFSDDEKKEARLHTAVLLYLHAKETGMWTD